MHQDEEMKKGQMKDRAATLVAASQEKQDTIIRMNTAKPTPSRNVCEGRIKAGKEKPSCMKKMIPQLQISQMS